MKIVGFEVYTVTRQGEVINSRTGRVLKQDPNRTGYKRVTLSYNGRLSRVFVHRLVALHYIPNPCGHKEVNHINGVKGDNRVENLEWVSSSYNKLHAIEIGLQKSKVGRTYLSKDAVHSVCALLERGAPYNEISLSTGVSYNSICLIKTKKNWVDISSSYKI